mgnify:CR=1 FL=1
MVKFDTIFPETETDCILRTTQNHTACLKEQKPVLIIISHALPVSWAANLNEIYARTHLMKNLKVEYALKYPSKLKKIQLEEFHHIINNFKPEFIPRFLNIFSKTEKDVAPLCAISGFKVWKKDEEI